MREGWVGVLLVQCGNTSPLFSVCCLQLLPLPFISFSINGEFCARQDLSGFKNSVMIVSCMWFVSKQWIDLFPLVLGFSSIPLKYNPLRLAVSPCLYRSAQRDKSPVAIPVWNRTLPGGLVAEAEQNGWELSTLCTLNIHHFAIASNFNRWILTCIVHSLPCWGILLLRQRNKYFCVMLL